MTTGVAAACPQCGAPLRFGGAASLAAVCAYCRSAVLRAGAQLELAGKVPDLVATDARLSLGAAGKVQGRAFQVLGRLQLTQGEAVWNEWYVSFGGAGWGWLAEAQGRLYVTRPIDASGLPALGALRPGMRLVLPAAGPVTVDEIGEARLVSFEGELPVRPEIGEAWRYADCSAEGRGFATLDYGSGGPPVLYAGREVTYGEAGIADRAPPVAGAGAARALTCPGCGGPVSLRRPDAKAFACPSCRSLLDVSREDMRVVGVIEGRTVPSIPLGAKGTLRGEALEVLGFLVRSIEVDEERYPWHELLLHGPGGYRWISVYGGHWLYLRPVPGGEVSEMWGHSARREGRTFKHFQGGDARYDEIQGEFYWHVRAGEEVRTDDYVAPPFLLSAERIGAQAPSGRAPVRNIAGGGRRRRARQGDRADGEVAGEISWSLGEDVPGQEIWAAFKLPGAPPARVGVGAVQPNPISARLGPTWRIAGIALVVLLALAGMLALRPHTEALSLEVPLQASRVTLSEPFELTGSGAVEIEAESSSADFGLDVAIIDDATGESEALYVDVEPGTGGARGAAVLGALPGGRYVLRVEPQVEGGHLGDVAHVRVVRGAFLDSPLVAGLLLLLAWPVLLAFRASALERRRWEESDHPWGGRGSASAGDGEEDDS